MKIVKYYTHQRIIALIKRRQLNLKDNRYAAIEPFKNTFIKLNNLLESFSHIELREHTLQNFLKNEIENN